jgi:hypothetical protein
LSNSFDANQA